MNIMNLGNRQAEQNLPIGRPQENGSRMQTQSPASQNSRAHPAGAGSAPDAKTRSAVARIDLVKQDLDRILLVYPPFFPVGSPQRIDLIKKIRSIQDEVDAISPKKGNTAPIIGKITESAGDKEIAHAVKGLLKFRHSMINGQSNTSGTLFDSKI